MSTIDSSYAADGSSTEPMTESSPSELSSSPSTGGVRIVLKREGAESEHVFKISGPVTVGRFDPSQGPIDIDMKDLPEGAYISRKHAMIRPSSDGWEIADLGSSNGTWVMTDAGQFEKVESSPIHNSQEFALGNARFVFYCENSTVHSEEDSVPPSEEQELESSIPDSAPSNE